MSEQCSNCRFFWAAKNMLQNDVTACRRYPPIGPHGWARTKGSGWCGEYREAPNVSDPSKEATP